MIQERKNDMASIIKRKKNYSVVYNYVKENEDLMNKARDLACHVIYDYYDVKGRDWNTVKSKLRDEISHLMYEKTKRSPMVLPILMEI